MQVLGTASMTDEEIAEQSSKLYAAQVFFLFFLSCKNTKKDKNPR
jgi:hypothetical protein